RPHGEPPDEALVARLLAARSARPQPARDDKVVVAYNAQAVHALARSARLLGRDEDRALAAGLAQRLLDARRGGALPRTLAADSPPGVLADSAELALALVELHQATGELAWLLRADEVLRDLDARFWDDERGLWRDS